MPPIPPMPPPGMAGSSFGISVITDSAVESNEATPEASISPVLTTCETKMGKQMIQLQGVKWKSNSFQNCNNGLRCTALTAGV